MNRQRQDSDRSTVVADEKPEKLQNEHPLDEEGRTTEQDVDYSGATKKTDPKEIALVRKLDRWIMPTLWG